MKSAILKLSILVFAFIAFACDNDDDSPTRSADNIEITIDSGTPLNYSTNIMAQDVPMAPTSGFSCMFQINSEDTSNNTFKLTFAPSVNLCPYTISTPQTSTLIGSQISVLQIQGVDIDYTHSSNSITMNYQLFGTNSGDDIKITFNGTYYDNSGNSHIISGDIDIEKS